MKSKIFIRKQLLNMRKNMPKDDVRKKSLAIQKHLLSAFGNISHQVIAGYFPINNEVDIFDALNQFRIRKNEIALPVTHKQDMIFRRFAGNKSSLLRNLLHGAKEPDATNEIVSPDIVFTPLVAFDSSGNRIGYGGGYYDKIFTKLSCALKIGIAFCEQEVKNIPANENDIRLDYIATQNNITKI